MPCFKQAAGPIISRARWRSRVRDSSWTSHVSVERARAETTGVAKRIQPLSEQFNWRADCTPGVAEGIARLVRLIVRHNRFAWRSCAAEITAGARAPSAVGVVKGRVTPRRALFEDRVAVRFVLGLGARAPLAPLALAECAVVVLHADVAEELTVEYARIVSARGLTCLYWFVLLWLKR
eukprot:6186688-Pleurochrysis_carterae.AAC.4